MRNIPSVLHFSTGFPLVIGLHHVEDYKEIKGADPSAQLRSVNKDGIEVQGFGVTHGYHHYVIATRQRCMISSFSWDPNQCVGFGHLEFETGYKKYLEVPFRLMLDGTSPYPFPTRDGLQSSKEIADISIARSETGHPNRLLFKTKAGYFGYFLEPDLFHYIEVDDRPHPSILDFEVQYIGISTGRTGNRDFANRLWNHEKVREISGLIQRDSPNLQVYVFGYQSKYVIEPVPNSFITNSRIIESQLGMQVWARVLEAGLISRFQPKHNEEFKGFLVSEYPDWLPKIRDILVPKYEPRRPCHLSVTIASDCRHNPDGAWKFGRFFTASHPAEDLVTFSLDLTDCRK